MINKPVQFKHVVTTEQGTVRNQQAGLTFNPVLQAARRIQSVDNRALALMVIQWSVDNADDTCVLEKEQPLTEWNAMFVGSLQSVLSNQDWLSNVPGTVGQMHATRRHVEGFFAKHGIRA